MPHVARRTEPALVTVSGAAAVWTPSENLTIPRLLARADEALYDAKAAGRNHVRLALGGVTVPIEQRARSAG